MSLQFLSSTDQYSNYLEFDISAAISGKHKDLSYIYSQFDILSKLSNGDVFKRRDNSEIWFVGTDKVARKISEERLQFFYKWDKSTLQISEQMFSTLTGIGGIPTGANSFTPQFLQFPCKVKTISGEVLDLCIVHVCKTPPFQDYFKNLLLIDDIEEVIASDFSLPHDLRLQSLLVDEIRMAFRPFVLEINTGEKILYNGITEFASSGEVKGDQIIREIPFSYKEAYSDYDVTTDKITYVVAKWDNRCEELFEAYHKKLKVLPSSPRFSEENKSPSFFHKFWSWL